LVAILVSNQLSRVLGQAADNQYGRHLVFDLIALGAIMNLSVIVPVGLLLAVVLTLGRLYHDSEMAALQACGFGPARLLVPLFCFAAVIAVGLGWLVFVQVPQADSQAHLLRQSALKEAQFGQLDAGRFRSFSGGDAVFYAERVDQEGVLHNVFVQRESAGRIEVALADTATYSKAALNGMHLVTLFNGRRYEGAPGRDDFRVIEFREHGIPIATPADTAGSLDPDTKPTRELFGSDDPSDIAQLQFRTSTPLMALVLTLIAVPLSRLRPRQGRYTRIGFAIVIYFVYSNLLSAAKVWIEKGDLPPVIGVWWIHLAALALGLYLVFREARTA
jgi:lipopolysaccharide export system permease protein